MKNLRMWLLPNNGFETIPAIRQQLAGFMREHPGLRVTARVRTALSMWDSLFGLLKNPHRADCPDIVQIPAHWTSTLAHLGILQELGELEAGLDLRAWALVAKDGCRLEGTSQIYSLPWWLEIPVLYYRKDALAKIRRRPAEALAGWDGLVECCRALQRYWKVGAGRYPIGNSNPREAVSMTDLAPVVWARKGDFFSPDGSRCLYQRDDAFGGIRNYFSLLHAGFMPLIGLSGLPPGSLFTGHCALQFAGRFPRPNGGHSGIGTKMFRELGVLPFPGSTEDAPAAVNVYNLAILRDSASPQSAYRLLRELVREAAALSYARSIGAFAAVEGGVRRSLEEHPAFLSVFERALSRGRTLPNLRVLGTLEKIFDRAMERVVREIMLKRYAPKVLRKELIHSAAEIDYVLSLYQN